MWRGWARNQTILKEKVMYLKDNDTRVSKLTRLDFLESPALAFNFSSLAIMA